MKRLKVLIVEDEVLIAETIRLYLEEIEHSVTSICISYDEAIESYHINRPDIVLLDIRLYGDKSGIDLAQYLNAAQDKPPYIFLTSQYDKRILDAAIQTLPYGYITKPFVKETLMATIETAYTLYESKTITEEKIEIYDGKLTHLLYVKDILYLQSDHVYIKFILQNGQTILSRMSFQDCFEKLGQTIFFQCHRSYIINLNGVRRWNKEELTLQNNDVIPISRSRKEELILKLASKKSNEQ